MSPCEVTASCQRAGGADELLLDKLGQTSRARDDDREAAVDAPETLLVLDLQQRLLRAVELI